MTFDEATGRAIQSVNSYATKTYPDRQASYDNKIRPAKRNWIRSTAASMLAQVCITSCQTSEIV